MANLMAVGALAAALAGTPVPWFTDVTESAGITPLRHGESVVAVDLDGDHRPELYLPCVRERGRLYTNLGNMSFRESSQTAGIQEKGGVGAAAGDLNGDGRPDLYVVRGADPYVAPNLVFLQQPDGTYREAGAAVGVAGSSHGLTVTMADLTGDGWADAFIPGWGGDRLYRNDGTGSLADASQAAGIVPRGRGWAALASDFDGDGRLDIFSVHGSYADPHENRLYFNQGNGRFAEATAAAGLRGSPWSLGGVSADFDGDGDFDLYVAGYGGPGKLYRNDGNGTFTDVTAGSGITAARCVGAAAGPIDGDLLPDLVVAGFAGPVQIYRNLGNFRFAMIAEEDSGIKAFARNEGLALADLDEDGDLDLYIANLDGNNRLYRNNLDNGRFLKVRFERGGLPHIGAVARLSRDGRQIAVQELAGASGMGQGAAEFLFRLPDDGPFTLSVTLPGGQTITRQPVRAGALYLSSPPLPGGKE